MFWLGSAPCRVKAEPASASLTFIRAVWLVSQPLYWFGAVVAWKSPNVLSAIAFSSF